MPLIYVCGICYLAFGCVMAKTTQRSAAIDRIVVLAFTMFFGMVFPLIYYAYACGYVQGTYAETIANISGTTILEYYACATMALIGIVITFGAHHKSILHMWNSKKHSSYINENHVEWANWLFLFLGIGCSYLYYKAYGGYTGYLQYSGKIRSGVFLVHNPYSFLIVFRNFSVLSAFLSFARVFSGRPIKIRDVVLLSVSLVYSIMTLYSNQGRVAFAFFFLVLMLYLMFRRQNKYRNKGFLFPLMCISVIALGGIYVAGAIFGRNDAGSILEEIIGEVSFPFHNFSNAALCVENGNYRFFKDLIIWPVFVLPTSIWSSRLGIQTSSTLMTIMTFGASKGEKGVYGELPVDFLSQVYMQLGMLGVLVSAAGWCFWGCRMLGWIDKNIENEDTKIMLKCYVLVEYFLRSILYCDPYHIVQRMFPFIAFMLFFSTWKLVIKEAIEIRLRS